MGGIVAFKWGEQKMTLLQNRDNWEGREITAAAWDKDNTILGGRCAQTDGTWFGVSKSGRVACLVDRGLLFDGHGINDVCQGGGPESLPILFLQRKSSPKEFAEGLKKVEKERYVGNEKKGYKVIDGARGLVYDLIVADITSSSMFHIRKPDATKPHVNIREVRFGVHTLSDQGLDAEFAKETHLRRLFNGQIGAYENKQLTLNQLAERVMFDRVITVTEGGEFFAVFVEKMECAPGPAEKEPKIQRYGTTSTTAFAVNPTKEVIFYEKLFNQVPLTLISFNI